MDFTQGSATESGAIESPAAGSTWKRPRYRFVDCFAGLGGFHVALNRLGHECVFACELDEELRQTYLANFGIEPDGDIRAVDARDVPEHEILCAGFPCQPFSLAGKKNGAKCPESGKLIDDVFRFVHHHRPKYVLLENVPNVLTIAKGTFWRYIERSFSELGYVVEHRIFSPLQFGIPQQRLRLFIVARLKGEPAFEWPSPSTESVTPLSQFIRQSPDRLRALEPAKKRAIDIWNRLVSNLPEFTSHTILAAEFGATYPLDGLTAHRPWRSHRGAFGKPLKELESREAAIAELPDYVTSNDGSVPPWMRPYVLTTRRLYAMAPEVFEEVKDQIAKMPKSWQKLEWRGDRSKPDLWAQTIQFRASGCVFQRSWTPISG
jgi:DNA (cytosine-5)-methyltransferase 1